MADFLSDAWFLAVNEKLASASNRNDSPTRLPSARAESASNADMPFVVAIELSVDPITPGNAEHPTEPHRAWHLRIDKEGAQIARGIPNDPPPTLTIFTDHATGGELASGSTNAQRAIDSGRLRVRGDLNALATMTSVFARLSTIPSVPTDL